MSADRPSVTPRPGGAKFVEPRFKDAGAFTKPARKRVNPVSMKRRKERAEAERVGVYVEVALRSSGRCELDPTLPGEQMHHRLRRSQGGKDTVENVVHLNTASHAFVHANPDWSFRHGWLLRRSSQDFGPVVGCDPTCSADHRPPTGWLEPLPTEENP